MAMARRVVKSKDFIAVIKKYYLLYIKHIKKKMNKLISSLIIIFFIMMCGIGCYSLKKGEAE